MRIVILSGGSGRRLWPLSNEGRAKQFLQIFPAPQGGHESMLMRVHRRILEAHPDASVLLAASAGQAPMVAEQLGDVPVCVEPARRDTFPAICLAAAYLHDVCGADEAEPIVFCSSDGDAQSSFYACFTRMVQALDEGFELAALGVAPTYPSAKYGYALPEAPADTSRVASFVEKPDSERAMSLIAEGALWNTGVYAMRLGYALAQAKRLLGTSSYEELLDSYEDLDPVSFDYAVAEGEENLAVVRYDGLWRDLGTWVTMADALPAESSGRVSMRDSAGTLAINELDAPLLVLGINDAIVCATEQGVLVASRSATSHMKPDVDALLD